MLTELMAAMEQIPDRRLLAGWVKSPTTALEHFSSHNLGLADWLLSGNGYGRLGSA